MVVASENRNRGNAAMAGGLNIVRHIADEGGLCRGELVSGEDPVNHFTLVQHPGIGGLEVVAKPEIVHLALEGEGVHRGQDEAADAEGGAPFQLLAGVRQDGDGSDRVVKGRAEMCFEFFQGDLRQQLGVKLPVGQPKGAAECFAVERGNPVFFEHRVGCLDDGP
jgi:hypothetical protein